MSTRFARSTREAFACDRFPAVEIYRAPLLARWWRPLSWLLFWATWAALGVLLAWRI